MPIIRSSTTAVTASDLPLERGGSSAVGRVRADRNPPARSYATDYAILVRMSDKATYVCR
jgi:hypothetical protein